VAAVPLLWIIPLSLYLVSFIVASIIPLVSRPSAPPWPGALVYMSDYRTFTDYIEDCCTSTFLQSRHHCTCF